MQTSLLPTVLITHKQMGVTLPENGSSPEGTVRKSLLGD